MAWKLVNPNITNDPSYLDPRLTDDESKINSNTTQLAQNSSQITNLQYYVSTKQFPRNSGETDDAPRIMRAINSLPNGGKVILEATTYLVATTLTIPQNITLSGQGYGKWTTGTSFHFTGTGACINFSSTGNADGIVLENFKIYSNSGDPSYHNFTGIDVNCGELMTIHNVLIQYANVGIKCSATTSYIYLLNIDNIFIYNCLNEGILVPVPSGSNYSNGIRIKVGDISNNAIGIHCLAGYGNSIIGDASEIGNNTTGGILIEGGVWTIKGNLWIENSPYGIQTTGGHTSILDEIYCNSGINQVGGSLYMPNKQALVNRISSKMLKRNLVSWFSFEEGSGLATYDRVTSTKGTFDVTPTWNPSAGQFGSTVQTPSGHFITLPSNLIDWTQDWTFLILGYGTNSNYILAVAGSDNATTFAFNPYTNGIQLYTNWAFKSNFPTFPNGDATTTTNWHIVSYKASTGVITVYNQLGRVMATYTNTLSSVFSAPTWVRLANNIVIDEFILYNRILSDSEIRGITELTIPPDVRNLNNKVMTSPDGSMWKQTIDNTGVATWTKL